MDRNVEHLLATVKLPTLPAVACRILQLCEQPEASLKDFAEVIEKDPALAARLLRFANSAYFGLRRKVASIERAAITLGINYVKAVALGFYVAKSIGRVQNAQFDTQVFWRDSLLHGCLARALAERLGVSQRDETFLAGLLQDIGLPFMASYYGARYAEMLAEARGCHLDLFAAELASLDVTHPALGGHACWEWGLPQLLASPIARHHTWDAGSESEEPIEILGRIAYLVGAIPVTERDVAPEAMERAATIAEETFGMNHEELAGLLQCTRAEFEKTSAMFSDMLPASTNVDMILAKAEALIGKLKVKLPESHNGTTETKILAVDDDPVNLALMKGILSKHGFTPLLANSAADGIQLARSEQPDLILLDVMMPEMDGYQACRILKTDPATADIPVIFCSAMDQTDDAVRGLELGAEDFVTKPVNEKELRARMAVVLRASRAKKRLDERSNLDALTGLWNRRRLEDCMAMELAHPGVEGLSCAMIDLDHFKRVNDSLGHAAGDAVLVAVGRLLQNHCRDRDWVCRYGGEEFVLAMPATSLRKAAVCAERLRSAIAQARIPHDDRILQVTASIGVATSVAGCQPSQLLHNADEAMYAAKQAGRNRVYVFVEGRGPVALSELCPEPEPLAANP